MPLELPSAIRLEEAYFCLNCEVITKCLDPCPACGHGQLWSLENWLGRANARKNSRGGEDTAAKNGKLKRSRAWLRINLKDNVLSRILLARDNMLTRREVLMQLRKIGKTRHSQLKLDCREFEQYMRDNHGYEIAKKGTPGP